MQRKSWTIVGVAGGASFLTLAILAYYGTHRSDDICTFCGQTRVTRLFQVPGTNITLFTSVRMGNSLVGTVIDDNGLVDPHAHNWKNVSSVGNGAPYLRGNGDYSDKVFSSPKLVEYLQAIAGAQSHQAIAKYLAALQDKSAEEQAMSSGVPMSFINQPLMEAEKQNVDLSESLNKPADAQPAH